MYVSSKLSINSVHLNNIWLDLNSQKYKGYNFYKTQKRTQILNQALKPRKEYLNIK